MDKSSNKDKKETEDLEERWKRFKILMKMHSQNNVIWYTLTNIMSIDEKINETKEDDVNISKSENVECFQSIPLRYLFSAHHRLPLSHMTNKMVMNEKEKLIYQLQVEYMLKSELNINKAFSPRIG